MIILDHEILCLALGIILGMVYYQKTGQACGGIITPGFFALYISDPRQLLLSFASGLLTCILLKAAVRTTGVYGRQRLASAMLISLALKTLFAHMEMDTSLWIGWMVPGLLGADMQKQGIIPTTSAVTSIGIVTAMAMQLLTV